MIKPPPSLVPLCPQNQPGHPAGPAPAWSVPALLNERTPADYLWATDAWYRLDAHPGVNAYNNNLAMQFAERAIAAQPLDYLSLAFWTATAVSPTDISAVKPWAKLMMMLESAGSIALAALVVARAINIL